MMKKIIKSNFLVTFVQVRIDETYPNYQDIYRKDWIVI